MKVEKLQLGFFSVNCYILYLGNRCLIIDPGAEAQRIQKHIDDRGLEPILIINTHGHYDHIGAVDTLVKHYRLKFYIHPMEIKIITNPDLNLSLAFGGEAFSISKYTLIDKKTVPLLTQLGIEIIHTPGHTPGSISIRVGNDLFCGDLLFKGAMGRTDLPGGALDDMKNSLKKIRKMNKNLVIYPGHGQKTRLDHELAYNYYLSDGFLN